TVTCWRATCVPTFSTSGTAPDAAPSGTCTVTSTRPPRLPFTPEAETTGASAPPTVTDTGSSGVGGLFPTTTLSAIAGVILPKPVPRNVMVVPRPAGLLSPFAEPSWLTTLAAPEPEPSTVKMPGTAETSSTSEKVLLFVAYTINT